MTTPDVTSTLEADRALGLARALTKLGRTERALEQYEVALAHRPWSDETLDEMLDLVAEASDWQQVVDRSSAWLAEFPDHATHGHANAVQHRRIDALCRIGGLDHAFAFHGLEPVARTDAVIGPDEIVAVIGVRNEADRLPHLFAHHRRLGVDRCIAVDNGSDDDTLEFLVAQPDCIVWRTEQSYRGANCGAAWWELVLRRHVGDQWCLIVDADETFVFPGSEHRTLRDLCAELDRCGATAYQAIMLDCYGDQPLADAVCAPGQDPLEVFPYFDLDWYRTRRPFAGPRRNLTMHWGGVRARIFGGGLDGFLLDKLPVFRHRPGQMMMSGNHWTDRATAEFTGRGALLHCTYDRRYADAVRAEAERGEHAGGARTYQFIAGAFDRGADPVLFHPDHSVRYEGTDQLLRLGILREVGVADRPPVTPEAVRYPSIPPRAPGADAPHWSVVVDATSADAPRRVEAALGALADEPSSEVVVVAPPITADATLAALDRLAEPDAAGPHVVRVVRTSQHPTAIGLANLGIQAAHGAWVHVLGVDGEPTPDGYASVRSLVAAPDGPDLLFTAPGPGATPLDTAFDLPPAAFVARRECWCDAGGLGESLTVTAGWEALQRLGRASGARVVGVPHVLGRRTAGTGSAVLGYGNDVIARRAAIDLAAAAAPLDSVTVSTLLDRCAHDTAALIADDLERGRLGSAVAAAGEVLRLPLSESARAAVTDALARSLT